MERYIILMSIKVVCSFLEIDLFMREREFGGVGFQREEPRDRERILS